MKERRGYILVRGIEASAVESLLVGYLSTVGYRPPEVGEVGGGPDGRGFRCSEPLGEWLMVEERPGHFADVDLAEFLGQEGRAEAVWIEYDEGEPRMEVRYYKGPQLAYKGEELSDPHPLLEELADWLKVPPPPEEGLRSSFERAFLRDRPKENNEEIQEMVERLLKSRSPGFRHSGSGLFQAPVEEGLWVSLLFEDWREAHVLFSRYPEVGNYERRSDVLHYASPGEALRALSPWRAILGPRAPSPPQGVLRPEEEPARVQSFLTSYVPYCLKAVERILPIAKRQLQR